MMAALLRLLTAAFGHEADLLTAGAHVCSLG
jgi:hypothetical protein